MGILEDRPGVDRQASTADSLLSPASAPTVGDAASAAASSPAALRRPGRSCSAGATRSPQQVTELHWDLGGLAYEMAIRDHFRLDVLVRRAAVLQERDAELAEVERLLRMEHDGVAGSCPQLRARRTAAARSTAGSAGSTLMERRRRRYRCRAGRGHVRDGRAARSPGRLGERPGCEPDA